MLYLTKVEDLIGSSAQALTHLVVLCSISESVVVCLNLF